MVGSWIGDVRCDLDSVWVDQDGEEGVWESELTEWEGRKISTAWPCQSNNNKCGLICFSLTTTCGRIGFGGKAYRTINWGGKWQRTQTEAPLRAEQMDFLLFLVANRLIIGMPQDDPEDTWIQGSLMGQGKVNAEMVRKMILDPNLVINYRINTPLNVELSQPHCLFAEHTGVCSPLTVHIIHHSGTDGKYVNQWVWYSSEKCDRHCW